MKVSEAFAKLCLKKKTQLAKGYIGGDSFKETKVSFGEWQGVEETHRIFLGRISSYVWRLSSGFGPGLR